MKLEKKSTIRNEKLGKMLDQRNTIITKMLYSGTCDPSGTSGAVLNLAQDFFTKLFVKYFEQYLANDFSLR
jgi:hypothetical protein